MKDTIGNIIGWIIVMVLFAGLVYVFRVMPYDNDWSCAIAECRKVKQ